MSFSREKQQDKNVKRKRVFKRKGWQDGNFKRIMKTLDRLEGGKEQVEVCRESRVSEKKKFTGKVVCKLKF